LKVKVTNKNEREREPKNTEKSIPKPDLHSAPAKSPQENQEDQENEKVDQRSRRLPLLGKNHAISEPVDYRENCQCHIDCPDCEFIGKTEVKFGFRYTFCPDFNSKLFLRPAADQWGEEDLEGNVYLAEQQFQESRAQ
ncbi:hypothetical protein, partial [Halobacillus trueperi]|uniref:hypothetical protein n=1 Tax=Halobacillus trueperi TaxID=156205 RepID=UPI001C6F5D74